MIKVMKVSVRTITLNASSDFEKIILELREFQLGFVLASQLTE